MEDLDEIAFCCQNAQLNERKTLMCAMTRPRPPNGKVEDDRIGRVSI